MDLLNEADCAAQHRAFQAYHQSYQECRFWRVGVSVSTLLNSADLMLLNETIKAKKLFKLLISAMRCMHLRKSN